jgi:hypothetical protein
MFHRAVQERLTRVSIVIGLLIAAAVVMMVSVLVELVCDLSRQSYQAPPNLDSSDDWDVEVDEFADAAPPVAPYTEQLAVNRYLPGSPLDSERY